MLLGLEISGASVEARRVATVMVSVRRLVRGWSVRRPSRGTGFKRVK